MVRTVRSHLELILVLPGNPSPGQSPCLAVEGSSVVVGRKTSPSLVVIALHRD